MASLLEKNGFFRKLETAWQRWRTVTLRRMRMDRPHFRKWGVEESEVITQGAAQIG